MKLSLRAYLYAAALVLAGVQAGQAEEVRLAPQFDPFNREAPAATYAAPEISLVNYSTCTDAGCGSANACTDGNNSCCPQPKVGSDFMVCQTRGCGWYAEFQGLALRPYAGGGALANGAPAQLNFEPAYRFVAGRQNSNGLGGQIRYFSYDNSDNFGGGLVSVEARYIDAELTQAVNFRKWGFVASGGLRYAEYNFQTTANNVGFDGIGLVFGTQAVRNLNQSGSWRMLAGARYSALFGNSKSAGAANQNDDLVNIMELNIGPQYRRRLNNGAYLTFGGGLEAQYWSNVINVTGFTQDAGFAGFMSSIGISR